MDGISAQSASIGTFSGSKSMRENYSGEGGVELYYRSTGSTYQNPHYRAIALATSCIMDEWLAMQIEHHPPMHMVQARILDLACGSGEATLAISEWLQHGSRKKNRTSSIPSLPPGTRLDVSFSACDPFTHEAYRERTGMQCMDWSFEDISNGVADEERFHLVISSYALHVASPSTLYTCLLQLSLICSHLIILSPHKKPEPALVERGGHWRMAKSLVEERVHAWLYESQSMQAEVSDELERAMRKGKSEAAADEG